MPVVESPGRAAAAEEFEASVGQRVELLSDNEADWTDWIIDAEPAEAATTIWERAQRAAHRGDAGVVRDELGAASRRYSPAGRRMLAAGVLNFLARRIEQQRAER